MQKACVAGYPIKHSLSPIIHNYWLEKYGIEGQYDMVEVKPENLKEFINSLPKKGYLGCNLTIPLKEEALKVLANIDPFAKSIGAVNTVMIKDGYFFGTNTDFLGFARNIQQKYADFKFDAGEAVILGAGGAARACIFALLSLNTPKITIVNRNLERAEALKMEYITEFKIEAARINICTYEDIDLSNANLLVNTTSLGMKGQPELDIDLSELPKNTLVNDIVYNPLETKLLADVKNRGNKIVDGLGMLLHQAAPAFEAWFGVAPEVDDNLRALVEKAL